MKDQVKNEMINKKILDKILFDLLQLEVKKLWKINENSNKIKVRRDSESEYSIYLNGHYVTTLEDASDTFNMVKTLLLS